MLNKLNTFLFLTTLLFLAFSKLPKHSNTNNKDHALEILIQYCTSCSFQESYQQLENAILNQYYNKVKVIGETYPIGSLQEILIKILTSIQFGFIIILVLFDSILSKKILMWQKYISPYRLKAGALTYFIIQMIIQSLQSTGAFEIFINGKLIHSKLESGQMPNFNYIIDLIRSQL